MRSLRGSIVISLITGLIAGGCQLDPPAKTVVEYRPRQSPVEKKAPDSQVYVLWRWRPIAQAKPGPTSRPLKQFPVEVQEVWAQRGVALGFFRKQQQLIAVAGATTLPVEDAHYVWRTQPGTSVKNENQRRGSEDLFSDIGTVMVVGMTIAAMPFLIAAGVGGDDNDADSDPDFISAPNARQANHPPGNGKTISGHDRVVKHPKP